MSQYSKWPVASGGGGGSGTVTSVAINSTASFLSVTGSPITSSGTITLSLANESANTVFAGPTTGAAAAPTFRSLVIADIPLIPLSTGVTGVLAIAHGGTNSSTALNSNRFIISSGGAIVENAAVTASRALASDSNGLPVASATTATELGYVSGVTSAIQTQLNSKQATLTIGNLTDAGTDGIVITGGTGSVIGSGTSIAQHVADTTHNGYLSSTDWNTFSGKQSTVSIGNLDVQAANAQGLALVSNVLSTQSADATHPGMVNNTTQTLSGNKTLTGATSIANSSTAALSINTTSFIFDATNNAIGIGTAPASGTIIDSSTSTSGGNVAVSLTGYGTGNVSFRTRRARGTAGSPTAVQSGDVLGSYGALGYGTSQFSALNTGFYRIIAGETFTNTSNATYLTLSTTPTTTTTAAERMRITAPGNVLINTTTDDGVHVLQVAGSLSLTTALETSYGGTGLSSIGTANKILGVNIGGTALEYKTISASSSKISVTFGAGTIALDVPDAASGQSGAVNTSTQTFGGNKTFNGTLTAGAAFYPKVVNLTDAATITTDASLGNQMRVTLGGNRTLANPTNGVDGQKIVWEFTQDSGGGRTITLGNKFVLGTTISSTTLSTAANKKDFMGAVYNVNTDLWYVLAFAAGY